MSLPVCHTHPQEKKKAMQEEEEKDQALQAKANLAIPLVPESEDDRRLAALLRLHTLDCEWWHWTRSFMGGRGRMQGLGGTWSLGDLVAYSGGEKAQGVCICYAHLAPEPQTLARYLFFPTAYEDKQKLKRTEIIHRSWFPSAQGPSASSSKASTVLKKLCQGRRPPPSTTGTVGDLGIVRRRSQEVPESPQCAADSPLSAEPRGSPGATQDRPQETAESTRNCRDQALPLGSSQEDLLCPSNPSASLVADYSDSESE